MTTDGIAPTGYYQPAAGIECAMINIGLSDEEVTMLKPIEENGKHAQKNRSHLRGYLVNGRLSQNA
jgi:hypothetical protein